MRISACLAVLALFAAAPAAAQGFGQPPDGRPPAGEATTANAVEILIKTSLMSFNDANLTANYAVWHARLHPEFMAAFTPEKLADSFKPFRDARADLSAILPLRPVLPKPAMTDDKGILHIEGHFESRPNRVSFRLEYKRAGAEWKLFHINVSWRPPE